MITVLVREINSMKKTGKAIILIIISAFFFTLMSVFTHKSGALPTMQKAFFRNFIAMFVAIVPLAIKRPKLKTLNKKDWAFMTMRSVAGLLGIICNFYAVDKIAISDAAILNKMSPFFAIISSYFILKEKLSLKKALLVGLAFVGAVFVIKPTFSNPDISSYLVGFLGGISAGVAYTFVHRLGRDNVPSEFIVLFFSAFSSLVLLPFMIFGYVPMTKIQWLYLILTGISAAIGQFAITGAYLLAPARDVSIFDYSQIIFASIMGFLVFGQIPDKYSIIGYIVIISAALIMFVVNKREFENKEKINVKVKNAE